MPSAEVVSVGLCCGYTHAGDAEAQFAAPLDVIRSSQAAVKGLVVSDPFQDGMRVLIDYVRVFRVIRVGPQSLLRVHRRLDIGSRSVVAVVDDVKGTDRFALKMVPAQGTHLRSIRSDIATLKRFDHPNLLKPVRHFTFTVDDVPFLGVQLELCEGGSLRRAIEHRRRGRGSWAAGAVAGILQQAATGLAYLHEQGFLHGDIRSENVLLTASRGVKLTKVAHTDIPPSRAPFVTITGGARLYAPPEWAHSALPDHPLTRLEQPFPTYDTWGLGCVLGELVTLTLLAERCAPEAEATLELGAIEGLKREVRAAYQGAFAELVDGLLHSDPDDRLDAAAAERRLQPLAPAPSLARRLLHLSHTVSRFH